MPRSFYTTEELKDFTLGGLRATTSDLIRDEFKVESIQDRLLPVHLDLARLLGLKHLKVYTKSQLFQSSKFQTFITITDPNGVIGPPYNVWAPGAPTWVEDEYGVGDPIGPVIETTTHFTGREFLFVNLNFKSQLSVSAENDINLALRNSNTYARPVLFLRDHPTGFEQGGFHFLPQYTRPMETIPTINTPRFQPDVTYFFDDEYPGEVPSYKIPKRDPNDERVMMGRYPDPAHVGHFLTLPNDEGSYGQLSQRWSPLGKPLFTPPLWQSNPYFSQGWYYQQQDSRLDQLEPGGGISAQWSRGDMWDLIYQTIDGLSQPVIYRTKPGTFPLPTPTMVASDDYVRYIPGHFPDPDYAWYVHEDYWQYGPSRFEQHRVYFEFSE